MHPAISSAVASVSESLVSSAFEETASSASVTENADDRKRRLKRERDARYRANKKAKTLVASKMFQKIQRF